MKSVITSQVQKAFESLFVQNTDTVTLKGDCLVNLGEILKSLFTENYPLYGFRRAVGQGQYVQKGLLPLLIYVKDDTNDINKSTRILDAAIETLINLTIPVEYLLPVESLDDEDGQDIVHQLNKLLTSVKEVFMDSRTTKAILDHIKFVVEADSQLNIEQCESINNCLLLLRNILHIPENKSPAPIGCMTHSSMQNIIIWNLFAQGVDKLIIYLMACPQKIYWGVSIVQLIALMYKDQHVGTLQKLLNLWLEASYSDSSEDNESNTSPPDQGSGDDSFPIITSDPTSDSSDNGGNDRAQRDQHSGHNNNDPCEETANAPEKTKPNSTDIVRGGKGRCRNLTMTKRNKSTETENYSSSSGISSMGQSTESNGISASLEEIDEQKIEDQQPPQSGQVSSPPPICPSSVSSSAPSVGPYPVASVASPSKKPKCLSSQSEISDCGYATQVENQESISTSSNEDDQPHQKPVHQKPHTFQKTRYNTGKGRATTALEKKELRRKKLVKRSKSHIINMKGLLHHLPTDEDISNILKEFTVDFLLKGYGNLVDSLYKDFLTNIHIQMDTSHFFWLVTYFLKFATQLEVDPEHINPVLSYEVLSYLIFQGVWVYEELEICCNIPDMDLKPCLRRLHLVVTAIREFLQSVDTYKKMIHLSDADRENVMKLQGQIKKMEDLKMLFVLLLRQYNPRIQSRQYLQDLILTNHYFLIFLDNACKSSELTNFHMVKHLKLFATVEIMRQYGLLLENFKENGEFVNNCIFTMMHHIGGDLQNVHTLFQPSILKTFSQIWETDYEICDDWSDLIEYVIHKFMNTSNTHCPENGNTSETLHNELDDLEDVHNLLDSNNSNSDWTTEEKDDLLQYFNQNGDETDAIAEISDKYDLGEAQTSITKELPEENIITKTDYDDLMKTNKDEQDISSDNGKNEESAEKEKISNEKHVVDNDIKVLKEYLYKENKEKYVTWLQNVLLETCFVKLVLTCPEDFKGEGYIMESTVYYYALLDLPIPVIPWTIEQANILKHQPFVMLLHKLGFYLPVDTGKIFVRIPNFWTADYVFSIAQQLGSIDAEKLKFDISKVQAANKDNIHEPKCFNSGFMYEPGNEFPMDDFKLDLSVVRFAPLTTPLSIIIPKQPMLGDIPPARLVIDPPVLSPDKDRAEDMALSGVPRPALEEATDHHMDCSPPCAMLELERASNCDTASVASDLTRMCVSDEDEKVTLLKSADHQMV
ncbi:unnamed protein product [Acanthoscelides obtectus]|uniref:Timeless n=1 Tax=Acanthoscelides obtectus TaxID=200917 RepID=A0A9P0LT46_ACAOB|nr:unnamed protein product [Acanthoscelides obtectus]CAK1664542.1 Protein timeless [Acanthoscelides obtectus]